MSSKISKLIELTFLSNVVLFELQDWVCVSQVKNTETWDHNRLSSIVEIVFFRHKVDHRCRTMCLLCKNAKHMSKLGPSISKQMSTILYCVFCCSIKHSH